MSALINYKPWMKIYDSEKIQINKNNLRVYSEAGFLTQDNKPLNNSIPPLAFSFKLFQRWYRKLLHSIPQGLSLTCFLYNPVYEQCNSGICSRLIWTSTSFPMTHNTGNIPLLWFLFMPVIYQHFNYNVDKLYVHSNLYF